MCCYEALQDEVLDERRNFFMEVRSNRRREQTDPNGTPLKKVQDEQNVLQYTELQWAGSQHFSSLEACMHVMHSPPLIKTVMVCYLAVSFKLVWIGWV